MLLETERQITLLNDRDIYNTSFDVTETASRQMNFLVEEKHSNFLL